MNGVILTKPGHKFRLRLLRLSELDGKMIGAWQSLEERAMASNAYLSPSFFIPAIRHLINKNKIPRVLFLFIEKIGKGLTDLVGAGAFWQTLGTKKFPLPHLQIYRPKYSSLPGVLVDLNEAEGVLREFFRFFCTQNALWQGVEFTHIQKNTFFSELIFEVARELGITWHEYQESHRAAFTPVEGGEEYLRNHVPSRRAKEFRRLKRRMDELGDVQWRILFGADIDDKSVNRFIELEHMGWKGKEGTSLRSKASHETFFKEMVSNYKEKKEIFFTEVLLNGNIIASTCNLISGKTGFAFKIGWDPKYAKMAPGLLNEVEFIRNAPEVCNDLSYIDSGAVAGSFIDTLWKDRKIFSAGIFALTTMGKKMLCQVEQIRKFKRWYCSLTRSART